MDHLKEEYSISLLKEEDWITLDLRGEGPWLSNYSSAIIQGRNACCRGGTTVLGIPSTYKDPSHPIFVLTIVGYYDGNDVTTSFIVHKLDSYFSGYAHHDIDMNIRDQDIDWFICTNSIITLKHAKKNDAGFKMEYTNDVITELMNSNKGAQTMLKALYILKFKNEKQYAFMIICHLFAEPLWFTDFYQAVAHDMSLDTIDFKQGVLDVTTWETLSRNVIHFSRNSKFCSSDRYDLQRLKINKNNFRSKIAMLLCENPKAKSEWKEMMKSQNPQNFVGKREIKRKIRRRPSISLGTGSLRGKQSQENLMKLKQDLEGQKIQIQEMLISSGGLPDVWNNIFRALKEPEDYICQLIIENSDFFVASQDLSNCFDCCGNTYHIDEAAMKTLRSFVDG